MYNPEHRRLAELRIKQYAAEVYATFTADERLVVRFGMFPHDKCVAADAAITAEFAAHPDYHDYFDKRDLARLMAVGIMDAANAGPDKLVV